MTPAEWYTFIKAWMMLGQMVYWYLLRDDDRDTVVWDACLYPGKEILCR